MRCRVSDFRGSAVRFSGVPGFRYSLARACTCFEDEEVIAYNPKLEPLEVHSLNWFVGLSAVRRASEVLAEVMRCSCTRAQGFRNLRVRVPV